MFSNNNSDNINQKILEQLYIINNKLDTLNLETTGLTQKLNTLENQIKNSQDKIKNIDDKLDIVNSSCKNMDDHIGFVENVYDLVKSPFQKVLTYYYKDSNPDQLSQVKRVCNQK